MTAAIFVVGLIAAAGASYGIPEAVVRLWAWLHDRPMS